MKANPDKWHLITESGDEVHISKTTTQKVLILKKKKKF